MANLKIAKLKTDWISSVCLILSIVAVLALYAISISSKTEAATKDLSSSWWLFGNSAALSFNVPPNSPPSRGNPTGTSTSEGVTVVSGKSGDLKFWANGYCAYYRNARGGLERVRKQGGGELALAGQATATQTVAAFPLNDSRTDSYETRYAIVTTSAASRGSGAVNNWDSHYQRKSCDSVASGAQNAGQVGELYLTVIRKEGSTWVAEEGKVNERLGGTRYASEALTAVPDSSGQGYWVYTYNPNTIAGLRIERRYIDINGTYQARLSGSEDFYGIDSRTCKYVSGGSRDADRDHMAFGAIRANARYTKMAVMVGNLECQDSNSLAVSYPAKIMILDINTSNGTLRASKARAIRRDESGGQMDVKLDDSGRRASNNSGYYIDFAITSGDVEYVYATLIYPFSLYRYNVNDNTSAGAVRLNNNLPKTLTDKRERGGAVSRGPDGNMYIANEGTNSIIQVSHVNSAGPQYRVISLGGNMSSRWGLPQMVTIGPSPCSEADCPTGLLSLVPRVSVGLSVLDLDAGRVTGISGHVSNSGPGSSMAGTRASIVRYVQRQGNQPSFAAGSRDNFGQNECRLVEGLANGSASNCSLIKDRRGSIAIAAAPGVVVGNNLQDDAAELNLGVGDRVCYVTVVNHYQASKGANDYRYSNPVCVSVAKRPKVQFWGADVRSSRMVSTNKSTSGSRYYGSWAEYAIFSREAVNSASGARLSAGPAGRNPLAANEYNRLTFANTPSFGNFGAVAPSSIPAKFSGTDGQSIGTPSVGVSTLVSGSHYRNGNLEIHGGEVARGKSLVIKASGTVTIRGNITYATGDYASAGELPQLAISAKNIVIDPSVNRIDGWLIANAGAGEPSSGYVSTCGVVSSPSAWTSSLNSNTCSAPLTINGPVIAEHVYLRRTYGADRANIGTPAEIFNLRPDVYLWGEASTQQSQSIRTTYIKELPPRF